MVNRTLDWRPRFDPRSLNFKIDEVLPVKVPFRRNWIRRDWFDQGTEGACTGFGFGHVASSSPRRRSFTEDLCRTVYYEARRHDQWEGENYSGSSVLGAMEAAKNFGYIHEYLWATTLDEIANGVCRYGPMEMGVNWYTGMFDTDSDGFIHPTGVIEGGHALCIGGVDPKERWFRLDNSWGLEWGVKGSAKISFDSLDQLRREQGEFALPRKVRIALPQQVI